MSTRGCIGFRVNGKDYLTYNHSDSYPEWLGRSVLRQVQELIPFGVESLKSQVRSLRLNDEEKEGDPKMGDLLAILKAGQLENYNDFINNSLFCEWAYILNLDEQVVEVYKGSQTKEHNAGRYAHDPDHDNGPYYPCALELVIGLYSLATRDIQGSDGPERNAPLLHRLGLIRGTLGVMA